MRNELKSIKIRLWKYITPEPNSGCWLWDGYCNNKGYGKIHIGSRTDGSRRMMFAHRLAYEIYIGKIPEHLELDHKCRVTYCVNPEHLEPVTHRENLLRGKSSALKSERKWQYKSHCPRGHPYAGANLYITPKGSRACRICAGIRSKKSKRKKGLLARNG